MKERIDGKIRRSIEVKESLFSLSPLIEKAVLKIKETLKRGCKILLCGNGGSAADAQHIACEFIEKVKIKRNPLPAIALTTDTSVLTAVSNDESFDEVFARQLIAIGKQGDCLIAISTSGMSPNIIRAIETAKEIGIYTIGLLGKGGGKAKDIVDLPIVIPSDETARIQESHITIGHIIAEIIEEDEV